METRHNLLDSKRIVCKIGTNSILREIDGRNKFNYELMFSLAGQIAYLQSKDKEVIWVSSGAVGLGNSELNWQRSSDIVRKQVASSVGQPNLLEAYKRVFEHYNIKVGQILLTNYDSYEGNYRAKSTIELMLKNNILPIINENDVVATEEITYGDNDLLAAKKAKLLSADLLILLSNVNGVYIENTNQVIPRLVGSDLITHLKNVSTKHSVDGSGGISSKLKAAEIAQNIPIVVANAAEKDIIQRILSGEDIGTYLLIKDD
jgi:glutamate 5-kinase